MDCEKGALAMHFIGARGGNETSNSRWVGLSVDIVVVSVLILVL
jgi:hypothetical protein